MKAHRSHTQDATCLKKILATSIFCSNRTVCFSLIAVVTFMSSPFIENPCARCCIRYFILLIGFKFLCRYKCYVLEMRNWRDRDFKNFTHHRKAKWQSNNLSLGLWLQGLFLLLQCPAVGLEWQNLDRDPYFRWYIWTTSLNAVCFFSERLSSSRRIAYRKVKHEGSTQLS